MNKKTKKILNAVAMAAAGVAISIAAMTDATAQVFNNTGTYTGAADSRIRMLGGCSASGATSADIQGIGTTDATRIPGTVEWARSGDQTVPSGLYFTNLVLGNSKSGWIPGTYARTVGTTHVNGLYSAFVALDNVNYTAGTTFTYDGSNQRILGTGTSHYAGLALTSGAKTIDNSATGAGGTGNTGGAVTVDGGLTTNTGATVNITNVALGITGVATSNIATAVDVNNGGTLNINNTGAGAVDIASGGAINVNNGGAFNINTTGTGAVDILTGGAVNLTNDGAHFAMGAGTRLEVHGVLTRDASAVDGNIRFNHSTSPATVAYYSGTAVMPVGDNADATYNNTGSAYGRLEIAEAGVTLPNGNIYVAGNVNDALLVSAGGAAISTLKSTATTGSTNANDYNQIIFTRNPSTGMSGVGEVTGIVARNSWSNTAYHFNNASTGFTFANTSSGSGNDVVGFFVVPGANVRDQAIGKHAWDNTALGGISQRYVELINTAGDITVSNLTVGYSEGFVKFSDGSTHAAESGRTRTFKGLTSGSNAIAVQSVTPDAPSGLTTYQFGTITTLQTSTGAGVGNTFAAAGNTFLLTNEAQAIFATVRDGRWSDPLTWATGMQPTPSDVVNITHKIWTGDGVGYFAGSSAYDHPEHEAASIGAAVNGAYQLAAATNINAGGGLYIGHVTGSNQNNGTYSFGTVTINNNQPTTFTDAALSTGTGTNASNLNGLFISGYSLTSETNVFRALNLTNNGTFINNGILEIGCGD